MPGRAPPKGPPSIQQECSGLNYKEGRGQRVRWHKVGPGGLSLYADVWRRKHNTGQWALNECLQQWLCDYQYTVQLKRTAARSNFSSVLRVCVRERERKRETDKEPEAEWHMQIKKCRVSTSKLAVKFVQIETYRYIIITPRNVIFYYIHKCPTTKALLQSHTLTAHTHNGKHEVDHPGANVSTLAHFSEDCEKQVAY